MWVVWLTWNVKLYFLEKKTTKKHTHKKTQTLLLLFSFQSRKNKTKQNKKKTKTFWYFSPQKLMLYYTFELPLADSFDKQKKQKLQYDFSRRNNKNTCIQLFICHFLTWPGPDKGSMQKIIFVKICTKNISCRYPFLNCLQRHLKEGVFGDNYKIIFLSSP